MKKVIIIHGWESNPNDHWYQEEKSILENKGYDVTIPQMPGHSFVQENEWTDVINKLKPGKDDILIGHSLGAPTILRYLEKSNLRVAKVFLIAGFESPLNLEYPNAEYPQQFVKRAFDWKSIKAKANAFYVINQDKDDWVPIENGNKLAKKLGVKTTIVAGNNHFDIMDLGLINNELIKKQ